VIGSPALHRQGDAHVDMAMTGELDRVGEKVLEDLLKPFRVAASSSICERISELSADASDILFRFWLV